MKDTKDKFSQLVIAPVALEEFLSVYWEKQPLFIERSNSEHFASLLCTAELEACLTETETSYPAVQLVQSGNAIASSDYTNSANRIVPRRLLQYHRDGATIVMSGAHKRIVSLGRFVRQLQSRLSMDYQANLYWSPPGARGFNPHYDTHDVCVLQVSGSKTFRFYDKGVSLPLNEESFTPDGESRTLSTEITLTAGDTLYIPRGVVHDAASGDGEASLHITLGMYPVIVRDLLQQIIETAAQTDETLRQSVFSALATSGIPDKQNLTSRRLSTACWNNTALTAARPFNILQPRLSLHRKSGSHCGRRIF